MTTILHFVKNEKVSTTNFNFNKEYLTDNIQVSPKPRKRSSPQIDKDRAIQNDWEASLRSDHRRNGVMYMVHQEIKC